MATPRTPTNSGWAMGRAIYMLGKLRRDLCRLDEAERSQPINEEQVHDATIDVLLASQHAIEWLWHGWAANDSALRTALHQFCPAVAPLGPAKNSREASLEVRAFGNWLQTKVTGDLKTASFVALCTDAAHTTKHYRLDHWRSTDSIAVYGSTTSSGEICRGKLNVRNSSYKVIELGADWYCFLRDFAETHGCPEAAAEKRKSIPIPRDDQGLGWTVVAGAP